MYVNGQIWRVYAPKTVENPNLTRLKWLKPNSQVQKRDNWLHDGLDV